MRNPTNTDPLTERNKPFISSRGHGSGKVGEKMGYLELGNPRIFPLATREGEKGNRSKKRRRTPEERGKGKPYHEKELGSSWERDKKPEQLKLKAFVVGEAYRAWGGGGVKEGTESLGWGTPKEVKGRLR